MNIRRQLLAKHSRANSDVIEMYLRSNPNAIIELMACFFSEETVVAQRASQVVGNYGRFAPDQLEPWWEEMLEAAESPVHIAIRRCVARYFAELKTLIPLNLQKRLVEEFCEWISAKNTPVAVAVFAMQFIADRADQFPKQAAITANVIKKRLPTATAGFRNRGEKILAQLNQ